MAPYTNRDTTSPAAVISPACQSYHEISRVMATACTKPFATLSRIATALFSISPSVVVSVAVSSPRRFWLK